MIKKYEGSAADQAKHISGDPYKRLGNGIILQAVKYYRLAKNALEYSGWPELVRTRGRKMLNLFERYVQTIEDCEEFFKSDYIMQFTKLDGRMILEHLLNE